MESREPSEKIKELSVQADQVISDINEARITRTLDTLEQIVPEIKTGIDEAIEANAQLRTNVFALGQIAERLQIVIAGEKNG